MWFERLLGNLCEYPRFNYQPVVNLYDNEEEKSCIDEDEDTDNVKISSKSAFWNICNSIQGVAILAMPYVIKSGGWWSIIAIILVALLSDYTGQILILCHYEDSFDEVTGQMTQKRTRKSYADIANSIWPIYGKKLILAVQVLELLFMATLYPIVATSVLKTLLPTISLPPGLWVMIFGMLMLPNVFLRRLHHISMFSSITVISATCISIVVTMFCFTEAKTWNIHNLKEFDLNEFVASIGVIIASYSSQMYLSVIENDMRKPHHIGVIINYGYFTMTTLKIGIGVLAYLTFGDETSQVVTLNLPSGFLLRTVNIVVVIMSLTSYTLPMFTVFEILEKDSPRLFTSCNIERIQPTTDCDKALQRTVVRLALVFVTLIMAISVPHFCLVLSFIGSFTGTFLEIIFPCSFYLIMKYEKLSKTCIWLNVTIIVISLLFIGIGMYYSAISMITAFIHGTKEVWTVD